MDYSVSSHGRLDPLYLITSVPSHGRLDPLFITSVPGQP